MEPVVRYDDPAGLLPSQAEHSSRDTPERALWFSVLCQALQDASGAPRDVTGDSPPSRHARADRLTVAARAWVASNASRPGTFRWCCETFELDADLVRARLKAALSITPRSRRERSRHTPADPTSTVDLAGDYRETDSESRMSARKVLIARVSCSERLWLSLIAYNLGNLWRRLALPAQIGKWSLTSLQQRLVKA